MSRCTKLNIFVLSLLVPWLTACGGGGTSPTNSPPASTIASSAGSFAASSAPIVVVPIDKTPPTVSLIGSATVSLYVGDAYVEAGASALDAVDGNVSNKIVTTGTVDTATLGSYTLTYSVTDAAGNIGTKSRQVTVKNLDYNFSFLDKDLRLWESEYEHAYELVFDIAEAKERTINVSIAANSVAATGTDVDVVTGTLVIPANSKTGSLKLAIHDDVILEGTETIAVKFAAGAFQKEVVINLLDETDTGTTHASLSAAVSGLTAVANGNDITVISGNAFQNYNLLSESTTVSSSFYSGIAVDSGSAFIYQGKTYAFVSGKLYEFNPSTMYTLRSTSPWFQNYPSGIQVLNDELYIVGGRTELENNTKQVLIYNFASGVWRQGTPLNRPPLFNKTAVANGRLYVFGSNYDIEVFDPTTKTWSSVTGISYLQFLLGSATALGNYIYLTGSELATKATISRYNTQTNIWETFSLSIPSRTSKSSFAYKGKVFFVGGYDNAGASASITSFYIGDDSQLYSKCILTSCNP